MRESDTLHNIAANARRCGHHENLCAAIERSADRVRAIEGRTRDRPLLHEEREHDVICCCGDHLKPTLRAIEAERDELARKLREGEMPPGFQDGWKATTEQINRLPMRVREWIRELETRADPAGDLRSRRVAEDAVRALETENERLLTALGDIAHGRHVPDRVLDTGDLYGWAQQLARQALEFHMESDPDA